MAPSTVDQTGGETRGGETEPPLVATSRANMIAKARELCNAGDFETAARQFLQAAAEDEAAPESEDTVESGIAGDGQTRVKLLTNASLAFHSAGKFEESLSAAQSSLRLEPKWEKGHYRRGEAFMGLQRYGQAAEAFLAAMECQPAGGNSMDSSHIQRRLEDARGAADILLQIQSSEKEVSELLKESKPEQSLEEIQKERHASDTAPKSASAITSGASHLQGGRVDEALRCFKDAVEEDPMNYEAHLQFGLACLAVGRVYEGIRALTECIRQEPGCLAAYTACAEAHATLGHPDAVVGLYAKLLGIGGTAAQGWSGLAGALYSQGKVAEAARVLTEAKSIESDPQKGINVSGHPLVTVLDAFLLAIRGRAAESAAAFMKHFAEAPLFQPLLRLAAAQIYLRAGEGAAAAERCAAVLEASLEHLPAPVRLQTATWINNHLDSPVWTSLANLDKQSSFVSTLRDKKGPSDCGPSPVFQLPQDHAPYLGWQKGAITPSEGHIMDDSALGTKLLVLPLAVKGVPQFSSKENRQLVEADNFIAKEFSYDDYGPVLLVPVVPWIPLLTTPPHQIPVSVRFFLVVAQSSPMVAYLCSTGVCFEVEDSASNSESVGDCDAKPLTLSSRLMYDADVCPSLKEGGDAAIYSTSAVDKAVMDGARHEAGRVASCLHGILSERLGSFRPSNHDKLLLPKILSMDMAIDEGGCATLTRLCPYPELTAVEPGALQTAAATVVLDAWKLVLHAAGHATELNSPQWPDKLHSLQRILTAHHEQ